MRYIKVVGTISLKDRKGEPLKFGPPGGEQKPIDPISDHSFVLDYICRDPKLGRGYDGIRRALSLDNAFKNAMPGAEIIVDEADHKAALDVLREKEWADPLIGAQLLPFYTAWFEAKEEPSNRAAKGSHPSNAAVA